MWLKQRAKVKDAAISFEEIHEVARTAKRAMAHHPMSALWTGGVELYAARLAYRSVRLARRKQTSPADMHRIVIRSLERVFRRFDVTAWGDPVV